MSANRFQTEKAIMKRALASVVAVIAAVLTATPAMAAEDDPVVGATSLPTNCAAAPADGFAACHSKLSALRHRSGDVVPAASVTYTSGYAPIDLIKAYQLPLTGGAGVTLAIVDAYASPTAQSDLDAYRSRFGLPPITVTQVNQNGGSISSVSGDTGWGQEEALDLDMASAICPSCKLLYVGGNSASFADLGAAVNTAVRLGATIVSNSYGASEFASESSYAAPYNQPGVAITVSSGDSGYGVQFPASASTVTAVGGTTLSRASNSRGFTESVWSGAGSGCSAYITKPKWQTDPSCSRRTVADVSAVADPNTGVAVYDSYGSTGGANWLVFGGTSVAAPIIAGVYGLAGNASIIGTGASYTYAHPTSLFDVTTGSNGQCVRGKNTAGAYLCTGVTGFDGPTGLGTPHGVGAF